MAIKRCPKCKPHPYQDKTYGKGMRVMTTTTKTPGYRCTVCGEFYAK